MNRYIADNNDFTTREVNTLLEVGVLLSSNLRLEEVIEVVMEQAIMLVQAETCLLWLDHETNWEFPLVVAYGLDHDAVLLFKEQYQTRTDLREILTSGQPEIISLTNGKAILPLLDTASSILKNPVNTIMNIPLISKGRQLGFLQLINRQSGSVFNFKDLRLCNAFASLAAVIIDNSILFANQEKLILSLMKALTSALDARDPYTSGHSERVSKLALLLGQNMGLNNKELEILQQAALLHDVGKIGIRDDVLLEPGPLNNDKWSVMKSHPEIGAKIIKQIEPQQLMLPVWHGVMFHQEKYDGSGYPLNLAGQDIPLVARIIAIADAFDAMTSNRPYRKGKKPQAALGEIKRCANQHFDPHLVEVFLSVVDQLTIDGLMSYLQK